MMLAINSHIVILVLAFLLACNNSLCVSFKYSLSKLNVAVLSASGGIRVDHLKMSTDWFGCSACNTMERIKLAGFLFQLYLVGCPLEGLYILIITGTEALFADLAHFPVSAIQT